MRMLRLREGRAPGRAAGGWDVQETKARLGPSCLFIYFSLTRVSFCIRYLHIANPDGCTKDEAISA